MKHEELYACGLILLPIVGLIVWMTLEKFRRNGAADVVAVKQTRRSTMAERTFGRLSVGTKFTGKATGNQLMVVDADADGYETGGGDPADGVAVILALGSRNRAGSVGKLVGLANSQKCIVA